MPDSTVGHVATILPIDIQDLQPERTFVRRRSIIREFALNTTTHGIPRIARGRSKHNRVFWMVSVLVYTGIMLFFIFTSIKEYFEYPTQTLVTIDEDWEQPFAAVTICNNSPMRFDRFINPFLEYTNERGITNTNDTTNFTPLQAAHVYPFIYHKFNRNESVEEFFYSLDELLISCHYNGRPCSAADFVPFLSSLYGRCYTFNGKTHHIRNGTVLRATEHDGDGLLTLKLYAHSHQYIPHLLNGTGLVVFPKIIGHHPLLLFLDLGFVAMIHDNRELPLIHINGIALAGGQKYRCGYTKKMHHLLGPPYTGCTQVAPFMLQALFDRVSDIDYSYTEYMCFTMCQHVHT